MIVGYVVRENVPITVTFDEDEVEFICEQLKFAYNFTGMFEERDLYD